MVRRPSKQKGITFGYCDLTSGQRVYPVPTEEMTDLLPEQQPPDRPSNNTVNDMGYQLSSFPPLGQSTIVSSSNGVTFSVLLQSFRQPIPSDTEIVVWHNNAGQHEWAELPLRSDASLNDALLLNTSSSSQWFSGSLSGQPKHDGVVSFTVKFRTSSTDDWHWMKDMSGTEDGELCYGDSAKMSSNPELGHFFTSISSDIKVETAQPETDDTLLYSLTCPVGAAQGADSAYQHHQLGHAARSTRWFALVRLWAPWLAPRHGKRGLSLDKDGVLLSFLQHDGRSVVCLAISGLDDVVTTFINDEHGNVVIKGRNDRTEQGTARVLVAVAPTFELANAAVFYHARKIVGAIDSSPPDIAAETQKEVDPKWLEEWYDGLTYCTWNGLGQDLTAEKIYGALESLSKENINITNLIIDDNWQDLTKHSSQFGRRWKGFEANKEGFPDGLKATAAEIRRRHPNINHIAVWHALFGYWGGVSPQGQIADNYKTVKVQIAPGVAEGKMTVVAQEDVNRMYNDFYAFLISSGIDSVKTDAQFFTDELHHAPDRRKLITAYQDAWTIAHLRHLSSRAISCMSQTPQILFHSQLPQNKPRLLVRNSDDFFPEVEASHPWHVYCNAYNSLFTQHLNVLPDWDMFQTSHKWATFHGAARCVSGGPIYITDTPGQHDIKLISQMTAQTPRGKTVILRPSNLGVAMDPYNAYEARALLKIGTYAGMARTGTSILGVFNATQQSLSEIIQLPHFRGTEEGTYIIGSFNSGKISKPTNRKDLKPMAAVRLDAGASDILSAYAVGYYQVRARKVGVALMGLVDKMTGSAALTGRDIYIESNGRLRIWIALKALGVFGVYISDLPDLSIEDNFMISIYGKPIPIDCVRKSKDSEQILEIDVAKAWQRSGEDAGWNNEVTVEIFMTG